MISKFSEGRVIQNVLLFHNFLLSRLGELRNHKITEWPLLEGNCRDHQLWILKPKFRFLNASTNVS